MKNIAPLINEPPTERFIPARVALAWQTLPMGRSADGTLQVAASSAHDLELVDNLQSILGEPVQITKTLDSTIMKKMIEELYGVGADTVADLDDEPSTQIETDFQIEMNDGAMAKFVDHLIKQAHELRATDIHIEPFENELLVRFRVDGLLHQVPTPPSLSKFQQSLCSRIKVMADMNIAEKRLPQDGRIRFRSTEGEMDIRVSTIPTMNGESVDMRILPRSRVILGLEELGMSADHRNQIAALIKKPNGIVLVTGPTGHGKTTTLYACLSRINTVEKKIITIEDPVEVRLRGVNQIQVHSKIGLTFAAGLRATLRQDPDVVMVGEIRDADTADIAIRASLTGHLVFSTLHTNDAVGALTRLTDMGVEPYLVASSLHAVLAQRLVRLLCRKCEGTGCESCRSTGFRGRTGIFELLTIDDEIRQMIINRSSHNAIRQKAMARGMRTLFQDGLIKAKAGLTTNEEILRVTEEIS